MGNGNYVIYADSSKCKGCRKCELACIASHNNMTLKEAVKHRKEFEPRVHVVKTETLKMPVQCHQCIDAPCAKVCPTQALRQDDGGKIVMRTQFCAGCGLCVIACPYGAVTKTFVNATTDEKSSLDGGEHRVIAVRCDLCTEWRAREGKDVSACVEACPAGALKMIPVEEYRRIMQEEAVPHEVLPLRDEQPAPIEAVDAQPETDARHL